MATLDQMQKRLFSSHVHHVHLVTQDSGEALHWYKVLLEAFNQDYGKTVPHSFEFGAMKLTDIVVTDLQFATEGQYAFLGQGHHIEFKYYEAKVQASKPKSNLVDIIPII